MSEPEASRLKDGEEGAEEINTGGHPQKARQGQAGTSAKGSE